MEFKEIEESLKKYRELYSNVAEQIKSCGCSNDDFCKCESKESARNEINFIVQKVLGYIEEKEVISIKCGIHKFVPIKENCSEEIKFMLRANPPDSDVSDWEIDEPCKTAIDGNSNLLIITNGKIFRLYAVGHIDEEFIQELIFEYDLLKDDLNLLCNDLWCLCRKGCGRKIMVNFA